MIVTYIYHSCYVIEFENFSLIIDFYKDIPKTAGTFWVNDYLLNKKEKLYVCCTHSHKDHFNAEILQWKKKKSDIVYIFSKEIKSSNPAIIDTDILFLDKLQSFEDEHIRINAFGSTDLGASFLIEAEGKRIFHAGDLNNWHWMEEVSKEEALVFENNFLCEIELLSERVDHLFLTFFPIDPRLGRKYMLGAQQFLERVRTDYFLPMHFGEEYEKANAFSEFASKHQCNYLPVTRTGQAFNV